MTEQVSDQDKEHLVFYTTLGCHLCDDAKAIMSATLNPDFFDIQIQDIADDDGLIELYGTRIPVIKRVRDSAELGWPFDPHQLVEFLSEY